MCPPEPERITPDAALLSRLGERERDFGGVVTGRVSFCLLEEPGVSFRTDDRPRAGGGGAEASCPRRADSIEVPERALALASDLGILLWESYFSIGMLYLQFSISGQDCQPTVGSS